MEDKVIIGWREWLSLPVLEIPAIKAKIDSGARTSALHTFELETESRGGCDIVKFKLHPLQKRLDVVITCESEIIDTRVVKDSGGHAEERFIINTPVVLNDRQWDIEISLTNREDMLFRMLLGRSALINGNVLIDPSRSYLSGRHLAKAYKKR